MTIKLTVKHHFSAGHRIPGLPGPGAKCANLHGHTFGVEWTFDVSSLDAREFEFAAAKKELRAWVDKHMDHGYLVAPDDEVLQQFLSDNNFKFFVVSPVPTTEAIAETLRRAATHVVPGVFCSRVVITEGPHNQAEVCL